MDAGSDISSNAKAWGWICEQITTDALHPRWVHRSLIDQLGVLSADLFRKISDCRLQICIGPAVAPQLFAFRNSTTDLRSAKNGWALTSNDPASTEYFEIVSRNVRRARVRLPLEKYRGQLGLESEPRDFAGNVTNEPSDDALLLQVSEGSLLTQRSFPVLDPE